MAALDHDELVRCLRLVGVTCDVPEGADWPVFEGDYLKFMGGPEFDVAACDGLEAWLVAQGYSYERHRDRAVRNLDPRAVERVHVLWRIYPEEADRDDDVFRLPVDWDLYRDEDGDWCLLAPAPVVLVSVVGEPLLLAADTLVEAIDEAVTVARAI